MWQSASIVTLLPGPNSVTITGKPCTRLLIITQLTINYLSRAPRCPRSPRSTRGTARTGNCPRRRTSTCPTSTWTISRTSSEQQNPVFLLTTNSLWFPTSSGTFFIIRDSADIRLLAAHFFCQSALPLGYYNISKLRHHVKFTSCETASPHLPRSLMQSNHHVTVLTFDEFSIPRECVTCCTPLERVNKQNWGKMKLIQLLEGVSWCCFNSTERGVLSVTRFWR